MIKFGIVFFIIGISLYYFQNENKTKDVASDQSNQINSSQTRSIAQDVKLQNAMKKILEAKKNPPPPRPSPEIQSNNQIEVNESPDEILEPHYENHNFFYNDNEFAERFQARMKPIEQEAILKDLNKEIIRDKEISIELKKMGKDDLANELEEKIHNIKKEIIYLNSIK